MGFLKIGDLDLGVAYNYSVSQINFDKKIRMASNKLVIEKTPPKWVISVVYKYLTEEKRRELYEILNNASSGGILVEFYNPSGDQISAYFAVSSIPAPKIANFKGTVPDLWVDVGFTLEEI